MNDFINSIPYLEVRTRDYPVMMGNAEREAQKTQKPWSEFLQIGFGVLFK